MNDVLKHISKKASSGKWLLTVAAAAGFLMLVVAYVRKGADYSISPDAMSAIISSVFTHYFLKRNGNGGE